MKRLNLLPYILQEKLMHPFYYYYHYYHFFLLLFCIFKITDFKNQFHFHMTLPCFRVMDKSEIDFKYRKLEVGLVP